MGETEFIILVIGITLLAAIILFLLSGLFIVKENECAVFEKLYQYKTHKTKGIPHGKRARIAVIRWRTN